MTITTAKWSAISTSSLTNILTNQNLSGITNGTNVLSNQMGVASGVNADQYVSLRLAASFQSSVVGGTVVGKAWAIWDVGNTGNFDSHGTMAAGTVNTSGRAPTVVFTWPPGTSTGQFYMQGDPPYVMQPPGQYKWLFQNSSGQSFSTATTFNSLDMMVFDDTWS